MSRKVIIILAILSTASALYSHGLYIQFGNDAPYLWVKTVYEGDIPLLFGLITIYSPDGREYQNGRSDRNGCFTFIPDRAGKWKVTVDDEMGHLQSIEIELNRDAVTRTRSGSNQDASPWLRWLLGTSLILLLTACLYIWKKR